MEHDNSRLCIPIYKHELINISKLIQDRGPVHVTEEFSPFMTLYEPSKDKNKRGDYEERKEQYLNDLLKYQTVMSLGDIRPKQSYHIGTFGLDIVKTNGGIEMHIPFIDPFSGKLDGKTDKEIQSFLDNAYLTRHALSLSLGPDMVITDKNEQFTFNGNREIIIPLEHDHSANIYRFYKTQTQRRLLSYSVTRNNSHWNFQVTNGIEEDIQIGEGKYAIRGPAAMADGYLQWVNGQRGTTSVVIFKEEQRIIKESRTEDVDQYFLDA